MAKASARKLKVYRTATGFHDAYVAAPSRKAALAAWGASADLFARGVAEEVNDPELMAEPLAHPGEVVRRSRGTAAEQIAALPPEPARKAKPARSMSRQEPSRVALDAAEQMLAEAEARARVALAELAEREARLVRERRDLERQQSAEQQRLTRKRDEAQDSYKAAMRQWDKGDD